MLKIVRGAKPLLIDAHELAWRDFQRHWRSLVKAEALFKLLHGWVLLPGVAVALAVIMVQAGQVAVSNLDIVNFLLTPIGMVYAIAFGVFSAGVLQVEQSLLLAVLAEAENSNRPVNGARFKTAAALAWRITQLGALKFGLLALTLVPFALFLGVTYFLFLSQQDINYYLADKPPVFWLVVGLGAIAVVGAGIVGFRQAVRWAFALPILLYERSSAREALRSSRQRVLGIRWQVAGCLLGWQVGALVVASVLNIGFRLLAKNLPPGLGESPTILSLILFVRGALLALISVAATMGQTLGIRQLYLLQNQRLGLAPATTSEVDFSDRASADPGQVSRRMGSSKWVALAALVLAPLAVWIGISHQVEDPHMVMVTAHRGHERLAPENTRAAIQAAIDSGADYAELDVQRTADNQIVVIHDRDCKRVAGDARQVRDLSLAEIRKLDAGSWFGPPFAGEPIPTLIEILELARGKIKLNIELKLYGSDPKLSEEVARILHEQRFANDCIVTSLSYSALVEIRRFNPLLRTGLIVSAAVGDVTKLDGEVVSVRADFLSDTVLKHARRQGQEVHVWTINDEKQMFRYLMRGIDNVITSEPDLMIAVRNRWMALSDAERLLLASRNLLGIE